MEEYSTSTGMPPQRMPLSKKTKSWKKQCVEAVSSMGSSFNQNRRAQAHKKENYDGINSIVNNNALSYVTDPYSQKDEKIGEQPARLRSMNLMINKVNKLRGEELTRDYPVSMMAINGEAVSEKEKKKKEMLLFIAQSKLAEQLGIPQNEMYSPETGEMEEPPTFESVEKYSSRSATDIREQWANHIKRYIELNEKLDQKFNMGWFHGLVSAEEFYHIGIDSGDVRVRNVNPLLFEFDRSIDSDDLSECDWFRETRWMVKGQIIDEYGDKLTEADIKRIDKGDITFARNMDMYPGFAYDADRFESSAYSESSSLNRNNSTQFEVIHSTWRSMKKIGFVTYPDENDEFQEGTVDETFRLTAEMKEAGYSLEWKWISEWWHGKHIGDIYFDMEPVPNQSRSMDNPYHSTPPYVGRIYNCINSTPTSVVDLIRPHQELLDITWYKIEQEMAKAKGKKFVMDMAQIPKSEGMNMEEWIYFFDNVGIAFINSFEEGTEGRSAGKTSDFNQFQSVDMTLSQSVAQYIGIIAKIEETVNRIVGINSEREGDVAQRSTSGGITQAINMSSHITEPWFYIHNQCKLEVYEKIIEASKFAYPSKKKLHYLVDDVERISLEIDMEKFSDSDYGVFAVHSSREREIFQKLERLGENALSSGAATFSDIIKMYQSNSISEISNMIEEAETRKMASEQQQGQMAQEMEQAKLQAEIEKDLGDKQFKAEQNQLDRENEIRKTVISSQGFDEDIQNNGVNDMIQYGTLALEESKARENQVLEERKMSLQDQQKNKELSLKEKEIESKERIEKLKAKTALKNKVPGEK